MAKTPGREKGKGTTTRAKNMVQTIPLTHSDGNSFPPTSNSGGGCRLLPQTPALHHFTSRAHLPGMKNHLPIFTQLAPRDMEIKYLVIGLVSPRLAFGGGVVFSRFVPRGKLAAPSRRVVNRARDRRPMVSPSLYRWTTVKCQADGLIHVARQRHRPDRHSFRGRSRPPTK